MLPSSKRLWNQSGWVFSSCRSKLNQDLKPRKRAYATQAPPRKPLQQLPSTPARTRFAPSPTGCLHLGSLRTALYNYLLAKATGGQFLLRIEDTDTKRTVAGAEERIYQDLKWAGLQWDEGPGIGGPFGPYKQSERTTLYKEQADRLVSSGNAYRCFCSQERLNTLSAERNRLGLSGAYDRACLRLSKEESDDRHSQGHDYVVRFKSPKKYPDFEDLVYGKILKKGAYFKNGEPIYEDVILLKSDGLPTYHLANIVDDHHMKITHVIRAVEWIPSTPTHLALYEASGWQVPLYAHVGLLQDSLRQKYSKRKRDLDIQSFREEGIFPEALINHVVLHGWSHNLGNDFLPLEKLLHHFDLKFTKGNAIVSHEKLTYFQRQYANKYIEEGGSLFDQMVEKVFLLAKEHEPESKSSRDLVASLLKIKPENYVTPLNFFERNRFFFHDPWSKDSKTILKTAPTLQLEALIKMTDTFFEIAVSSWSKIVLKEQIDICANQLNQIEISQDTHTRDKSRNLLSNTLKSAPKPTLPSAKLYHYLRWALIGRNIGPSVVDTMVLFGRDVSLQRFQKAKDFLRSHKLIDSDHVRAANI